MTPEEKAELKMLRSQAMRNAKTPAEMSRALKRGLPKGATERRLDLVAHAKSRILAETDLTEEEAAEAAETMIGEE